MDVTCFPLFSANRAASLYSGIYLFLIWYLSSYSLPLLVLFASIDVCRLVVPFFIAQKLLEGTSSHGSGKSLALPGVSFLASEIANPLRLRWPRVTPTLRSD